MVTKIVVLPAVLGGLKMIFGQHVTKTVFTVFDLHKMDVSLFWKELARVTDLESRQKWLALSAPCSPHTPSTSQLIPGIDPWKGKELVVGTFFIGTTNIASGQLEASPFLSGK
eukprot:1161396-Pelagomonas_calceolata.AAC.1